MADDAKKKLCVDVGQRIWQYRKEAGMTKEALAERMDITSQYLNDIEQGKKCMSMAYFIRLGQIFHISLDTLAWGVQPEDPAVDQMVRRLREMSPVDRDLAVHMILSAAKAVEAMGPET